MAADIQCGFAAASRSMTEPPFRPVIRTQADLEQMWRRLMSPLGFTSCALWLVVLEDDRPVPRVTEFVRTPRAPGEDDAAAVAGAIENLATPKTSLAFLRTRPGRGRPDHDDLAWAQTLYAAGQLADAPLAVVHLAHDDDVVPMPMDDLLRAPA
jgi:hypothetical protein